MLNWSYLSAKMMIISFYSLPGSRACLTSRISFSGFLDNHCSTVILRCLGNGTEILPWSDRGETKTVCSRGEISNIYCIHFFIDCRLPSNDESQIKALLILALNFLLVSQFFFILLQIETLIYRALSNALVLPWPNQADDKQVSDEKSFDCRSKRDDVCQSRRKKNW